MTFDQLKQAVITEIRSIENSASDEIALLEAKIKALFASHQSAPVPPPVVVAVPTPVPTPVAPPAPPVPPILPEPVVAPAPTPDPILPYPAPIFTNAS